MIIDELAERVSSLPSMLLRVLALMSEGLSNGQIAAKLGITPRRSPFERSGPEGHPSPKAAEHPKAADPAKS